MGGLTARDAQQKLDAIAQKESEKEIKRQKRVRCNGLSHVCSNYYPRPSMASARDP